MLRCAGEAAQPVAAAIGGQVSQSAVIGSDETSARVARRNWWQRVFLSVVGVYYLIRGSRLAKKNNQQEIYHERTYDSFSNAC
jgi:hypothetical protein